MHGTHITTKYHYLYLSVYVQHTMIKYREAEIKLQTLLLNVAARLHSVVPRFKSRSGDRLS